MPEKFSHCLRPVFTESLLKDLQEDRSLNLIGESGQGRRRLLEDIQQCHLRNTLILAARMKNYQQSYEGFIQALCQQAGEPPKDSLGQLLTALEQDDHQRVIFWLHDFDALLNDPEIDERYNLDFINSLNSIKNHPYWSLVCVTEQAYRKCVFILKEQILVSPLELIPKYLPKLAFEEIRYELKNRDLPLTSEELVQVTQAIHPHSVPYQLLEFIADDKLRNQVDTESLLLERLKKWKKEFDESQVKPWDIRAIRDLVRKFWVRVKVMKVDQFFTAVGLFVDWILKIKGITNKKDNK